MRWFLICRFIDGYRSDFACVKAWTRSEAYLEVFRHFPEAGDVTVTWDADQITVTREAKSCTRST